MEKKGNESMQAFTSFKAAVSQSFIGNLSTRVQDQCFAKVEEKLAETDGTPAPIQEHSMNESETKRTNMKKKEFQGLVCDRAHCSIFLGKKGYRFDL